jgi:hypothetical protein
VSGAQGTETLLEVLEHAWAQTGAAAPTAAGGAGADGGRVGRGA